MALVPDICVKSMQYELISEKGQIKHAANSLYQYYSMLRNHKTGFCFPSLNTTMAQTGIKPKSNVVQLRAFLHEIGWIHVYSTGTIWLLKGWVPDEQVLLLRVWRIFLRPVFVLFIRTPVLHNRMLVLFIRTLFKGSLNQPIKPAQLTREGAASSAPPAQPDENSKRQPAGKPAKFAAPTIKKSSAPRPPAKRKPADERINHPAVQMVKEITGRFATKDIWDDLIEKLGNEPDVEFFRKSFVRWRTFKGHPENFDKWIFEPLETKQIPQRFGSNGSGNGSAKPPDVPKPPDQDRLVPLIPLDERVLAGHLEDFRFANYSASELSDLERHFEPAAWAWLMEKLKSE